MSYGLRVWNASGGIIVDVTDRITKIVATYSFSKSLVKGDSLVTHDVSVPGILADGSWFVQGITKSPQVGSSTFYSYEIMSGIVRVHILKFDRGTYAATGSFTVYKV
jgi:hypothetical protein